MDEILVTGSTGFIGNHLIPELSKNYKILGISKNKKSRSKNFTSCTIDITKSNFMLKNKFKKIIHMAAYSDVTYCDLNPTKCYELNVKSTQKITKAMKMVAAAKLRKAQESAEKGRPYSQKMQNIILNLTNSINDPQNAPKLLVGNGNDKTYLCLVLTADRGLCGGFNSNICKLAKTNFKKILNEGKELKIITVGSKGLDQIKREYGKYVIKKISFKDKKHISFTEAEIVGQEVISLFNKNEFDKCILFYNNFKNVITQVPQAQQIIPAEKKLNPQENKKNFHMNLNQTKMKFWKICYLKMYLLKFLKLF